MRYLVLLVRVAHVWNKCLCWPGLNFGPKVDPKQNFGLALKVGLASNLTSKECLALNFKICFFLELKIYVIVYQLLIYLDTLLINSCINVYRSTKHIILELISFHKIFLFIHFVKFLFSLTLISHCALFSHSQSKSFT